jgi:hypothetical protein
MSKNCLRKYPLQITHCIIMLREKFTFGLMGLLLAPSSVAAAPKEPLRLTPSAKWHVDYAEDRCRLARRFGTDDQQTYAFFDRFGPGDSFMLTLSGQPFKISPSDTSVAIEFGPSEQKQDVEFFKGNIDKNVPALISMSKINVAGPTEEEIKANRKNDWQTWVSPAPVESARLAAIRYLSIGKPLRQAVILETGAMDKPLAALDKCVDELMTHWGIDVEKHKTLTREVVPLKSPGSWLGSNDYPTKMLHEGQPSIVEFRLNIGIDGVPTACHIQLTTRPKEFDTAVCKALMRRARFSPALDATGQALPSYWRSTVRFQIPY